MQFNMQACQQHQQQQKQLQLQQPACQYQSV
jgi:hypothetical protein